MATDRLIDNIKRDLILPVGAVVIKDRTRINFYLLTQYGQTLFEFKSYFQLAAFLKPKILINRSSRNYTKNETKVCYICLKTFTMAHHLEKLCSIECRVESNRRNQVKFKNKQKQVNLTDIMKGDA